MRVGPTSGILLLVFYADLPATVPEKPTPLVVGLVDGSPENQRPQAALAAKMAHIAEYP
jgi:hypothetical protein